MAHRNEDPDGFDAVADTVGAGIYSGRVKRSAAGEVLIGPSYAGHCPVPGPLYAGNGYTDMAKAIHSGPEAVKKLLDAGADPNEVMTGGARPLHTCGMSRPGQLSAAVLAAAVKAAGGSIDEPDCWGYTPLHRMASNGLAIGAEALIAAGADVSKQTANGQTPLMVAQLSGEREVADLLLDHGASEF